MFNLLTVGIGTISGLVGAYLFWRFKIGIIPPIVLPARPAGRPFITPYEVRMDGRRIYPGSPEQECTRSGAKSTYFDKALPTGHILELYQHGNHTASRHT